MVLEGEAQEVSESESIPDELTVLVSLSQDTDDKIVFYPPVLHPYCAMW